MNGLLIPLLALLAAVPARAERPYFQQRVNYRIKVDLDPGSANLAGSETIFYFNNSSDTLHEVYFHLYYNAFQPGSYLDLQARGNGDYEYASMNPADMGYVNIDLLKNEGIELHNYQIDNTVMKVPLVKELIPGDSTYFHIEFRSQVPARGNRTAHDANHFDVGQWYPKPALYDRNGWHANQYLRDSEFFADFADYDVEITLPSNYVLAHPGKLLNEEEIYGGKLPVPDGDSIIVDALKYIVKTNSDTMIVIPPAGDSAKAIPDTSVSIPGTGEPFSRVPSSLPTDLKTWKIRVENVHDISFSADPRFIMDICRCRDTVIKCYYAGKNKARWQRSSADFTRKAIQLYSESYFPYPYGQFTTVASLVTGGMEFPQLVFVYENFGVENRYSNSLESTIAHEVGHNWFYGILAFNETEEAFLDEGLTSLATIRYMEHYYGRRKNNFNYASGWQRRLLPNGDERNDNQKRYIQKALVDSEDPMNTPANLFRDGSRYYNASYYKASSVYLMLQYTLGDENFDRFIKLLFERWAYKHPYLSDVQEICEEMYGGDLRWFFRQWFSTTWKLDYGLDSVKSKRAAKDGKAGYDVSLSLANKGRCISPLDVVFYFQDASTDTLQIPVSRWSDGQRQYDTTLFFVSRPKRSEINPDLRLTDVDRLNNRSGLFPVYWQFMVPKFIYPQNYIEHYVESYTIAHNPTLWYNSVDGVKIGYELKGSYLGIARNVELDAAFGALNGKIDYSAKYEDRLYGIDPDVRYFAESREWEGRGRQELGIRYVSETEEDEPSGARAGLSFQRNYLFNRAYLFSDGWSPGDVNTIDIVYGHRFIQRFYVIYVQAALSSAAPGSDYHFNRMAAGLAFFTSGIGSGETRLFLKFGRADGNVPLQRIFYLSIADPYDTWESPLFRSRGTLPDKLKKNGHLFKPGGAGLAGYVGENMTGTRLFSAKLANDVPRIDLPFGIPVLSRELGRITSEAYFAGGFVWDENVAFSLDNDLWEAGFQFDYQIPYLDRLITESRISLYLPLWLSNPKAGANNLKWRWVLSLGT